MTKKTNKSFNSKSGRKYFSDLDFLVLGLDFGLWTNKMYKKTAKELNKLPKKGDQLTGIDRCHFCSFRKSWT